MTKQYLPSLIRDAVKCVKISERIQECDREYFYVLPLLDLPERDGNNFKTSSSSEIICYSKRYDETVPPEPH